MMSGRAINYEQASTYYEHSADYYTGHQSHYDKWHGKLAKRLKLTGELSKGEFETFCKNIAEEERRKRIGFDATFSAPKSVSLALAESDGRREKQIETAGAESAETVLSALRQIADFLCRMEQEQRESGYFTQRLVFNSLRVLAPSATEGRNKMWSYSLNETKKHMAEQEGKSS